MPDNRSLDEFAGATSDEDGAVGEDATGGAAAGEGAADESAAGEGAADESADTGDEVPDSAVEPATSTYRWSPEGAPCESCGEAVDRRWRDGDDLVCGECKEW